MDPTQPSFDNYLVSIFIINLKRKSQSYLKKFCCAVKIIRKSISNNDSCFSDCICRWNLFQESKYMI